MATCKDCIHNSVCSLWRAEEGQDAKSYAETVSGWCAFFTDKSRFVELPRKVGETVYRISKRYGKWEVLPREVEYVTYLGGDRWLIFSTAYDWLGKTVFLTREEAEAALAERTKK